MTDLSEREKLKLIMREIRRGIEISENIAILLEELHSYTTYTCGCRGKLQVRPHHLHKIMTVTSPYFCGKCSTCKTIPSKLKMYETELEFDPQSKNPFDKKAEFGIDMTYTQFEEYFQLF